MVQGVSNASAASYSSAASSGGQVSKDEFLKLLTYQLKSQNPMKPYDNQEFASQLAQFSQLEQLTGIKSLLEEQIQSNNQLSQIIGNSALPGMLGKYAKALSNKITYDGENKPAIGFSLPYSSVSGTVQIKNEAGQVVRNIQLADSSLTGGDHKLIWDGKDDDGNNVAAGKFSFAVTAKDPKGSSFTADAYSYGEIQAVRFKPEGTVLVINGNELSLDKISDISTAN